MDPAPGRRQLGELTGDARVDRWREHRVTVRADLVEATLRAIDEYGPDLSIEDIVKSAGVPRMKLYRFFQDKEALFAAAALRIQEMAIERVVSNFDVSGTVLELVRSALTAYIDLVDERPNIFRFLAGANSADYRSAQSLLEGGRRLTDAMVDIVDAVLRDRGGEVGNLEYAADAVLGAVAYGVLRWLNDLGISKRELVDEMTAVVWGALSAIAKVRGVVLDPDERVAISGSTG